MNSILAVAVFLAGITTISCVDNSRQPAQNLPRQVRPLAFEQTTYERKSGECAGDTTPCVAVRVQYPVAIAGTDTARQAINAVIEEYVLSALAGHISDSTQHGTTLDSLAATLFADYEEYIRTTGEYSGFVTPWEVTITGKVIHKGKAVITVEMGTYSYMGGAHPNYWMAYRNFDPLTGKLLALQDIATDTVKLKALAEKEFRSSNNLGVRENLETAGYWFQENVFALPGNYAFTDKGFLFLYNPYEIASYAQGPIEILLPYTRLKGLLQEQYLQ